MKRIRINHTTEYHYNQPVTFGPHRALMRPREGHDVHIESGRLDIEPKATVRWLRDLDANSVAIITFSEPAATLRVCSEVHVDLFEDKLTDCQIDPIARAFPFHYSANEQLGLVPYRLPSYPHDGTALQRWLRDLYHPGQLIDTFDLLNNLNSHIFESLKYTQRHDPGVQGPFETISLGSGSCRDYAVLMMEAARHWGFGAQFVTGYVQMGEGQHGATHAWTEIYIPRSGLAGIRSHKQQARRGRAHLCRRGSFPEDASPLSGFWDGPADAFETHGSLRAGRGVERPAETSAVGSCPARLTLAWIERAPGRCHSPLRRCWGWGWCRCWLVGGPALAWAPRGILPFGAASLLWIAGALCLEAALQVRVGIERAFDLRHGSAGGQDGVEVGLDRGGGAGGGSHSARSRGSFAMASQKPVASNSLAMCSECRPWMRLIR